VEENTRKFCDLMPRYGHEVTSSMVRRFHILASRHRPLISKWLKAILRQPELIAKVKAQDLMAFVDFCMLDLRLTKAVTFDFVGALPLVLYDQPDEYRDLILNWVGLCEQYDIPLRVLVDNPDILASSPADWNDRVQDLGEVFWVRRDLGVLLVNNPSVMTETGRVLKEKLDFFIKVMNIKPADLAHTSVFHMDLSTIKKRYLFLERCGLYVRPRLSDVGTKLSAEPHISNIVQGTDEEFVNQVTKSRLTIEEYHAFVGQLLPEELSSRVDHHELEKQKEEEELAGEEGYYDPSFSEDIDELYAHLHNYPGKTEKFSK